MVPLAAGGGHGVFQLNKGLDYGDIMWRWASFCFFVST